MITTGIVLVTFGILFFYTYRQKGTSYPVLLTTSLLYGCILFERTDVRPELFSFLFLSIFVTLLYRYRDKPTGLIFLLIPIEILWVNMHIYFFIGIIVLVLFTIDWCILHRNNLKTRETFWLTAVLILCCIGTLLNPNGFSAAAYPFHVFANYGYSIEENQNIFFLQSIMNNNVIPLYEITVFFLFLSLTITIRQTKYIDWLLALTFSIIGGMAIRNLPLFVFTTFLPFTVSVSHITARIANVFKKKLQAHANIPLFIYLSVLFILFLWKSITLMQKNTIGADLVTGAKPAADFYLSHQIKGPLFNNFDIGSYLEYRIYPLQKVFVDGRPEAYPADFFQNVYIPMQQDSDMFNQIDNRYHFNSIFFSHTDQTPWAASFMKAITANPAWALIYLDDTVAIYAKRNKQNENLIHTYDITQTHGTENDTDLKNTTLLFQLAHFYYQVGWPEKELAIYTKILQRDPKNCNALYNGLILLRNLTTPQALEYQTEYRAFCI